ncbi:MAG TPA: phosphoribosylformylglycinamidine synthase subunit PurQ [Chthoniobacteraceae bacterium]|nr:phosphoribosylformylglycinamidine synthase subunit PurQ [Chthoniobacteraceae bacterium]
MKAAVLRFPGSNCDQDCYHVLSEHYRVPTDYVWHKECSLSGYDLVVLPGGFSYGDYLRTGAIARFSPIMKAVADHAAAGGLLLGICNGFQILTESRLLPGVLIRNRSLSFICEHRWLRVENNNSPFLSEARNGQLLNIPIAHGEGNYMASPETLAELEANGQILLRYSDAEGNVSDATNPNGSTANIAGICNAKRNVFGLMPHPERAADPRLGSADGSVIFQSIFKTLGVSAAA